MDEKLTIWGAEGVEEKSWKRERPKKGLQLKKFMKQNTEIAFRVMVLLCAVLVCVSGVIVRYRTEKRLTEEFAQAMTAERFRVEQETIARMKEEYGINDQNALAELIKKESKIVAKVLYPMRNNREIGLRLACWAIFNRVDFARYPDDVYSVCSENQAFMGWSDNNDVLTELNKIALEEGTRWHNGVRPMESKFVYLYWTPNEIYLFDDEGHRYYESDFAKYLDSLEVRNG